MACPIWLWQTRETHVQQGAMMHRSIQQFLAPPVFPDEDKTRVARILHAISLAVLVVVGVIAVVTPFIFQTPAYGLTTSGAMALLMLGVQILIRQGYVNLTSRLLASALWALDTALIVISGGVQSGVAPGYVAVTVLAGLLLSGRAAVGFAGLSAVAGLGMLYAERNGLLPAPLIHLTPMARWLSLTANAALAAVLLYLATRSIERALERSRRDEQALAEANLGLQRQISERRRAEQALRHQAARLEILHTVDQAILEAQTPARTAQAALVHLRRLIPCTAAGAVTIDLDAEEVALVALQADAGFALEAGARLSLHGVAEQVEALRQGQVFTHQDVMAFSEPPPIIQTLRAAGVCSYVFAPLIAHDELIGALALASCSADAFVQDDADIVREVADQMAIALHQARLSAALEAERRRLMTAMEHMPEGMLLLDAERRVLLANPVAAGYLESLADAGPGEVLSRLGDRPLEELLVPPPAGRRHEFTVADPVDDQGHDRVFEIVARPVRDDEGPAPSGLEGWLIVLDDVTEQRQREAQVQRQQRLAAIGQLAGGIAHDFRNFLASILLYADLASRHADLPPMLRSSMETIVSESEQASQLVQQILDFSRRTMMKTQSLDLKPFVEEVVRVLERTIPENIAVHHEAGPGAYVVEADPTRIQQVLMNLALNARDAMPEGGELCIGLSRITVGSREQPPVADMAPGEWVCLSVSDTGAGMTEEVQAHLFEPFFTTKKPGMGTGLGLAQVHGIVEQHRGRVDVETELGTGSTFCIYLPARRGEEGHEGQPEAEGMPKGHGETILLVEDEDRVREAMLNLLTSLDYRVLMGADGREALELCQTEEPALVITDLVMPNMGGLALVQALRERYPDLKAVAITGYAVERDLEELEANGVADVIEKPFEPLGFAKAVRRVLDRP